MVEASPFEGIFICVLVMVVAVGCVLDIGTEVREESRVFGRGKWFLFVFVFVVFVDASYGVMFSLLSFQRLLYKSFLGP